MKNATLRKPSELDVGNIVLEDGRACRITKISDLEQTDQGNFFFLILQDLLTGSEHLSGYRSTTLLACR